MRCYVNVMGDDLSIEVVYEAVELLLFVQITSVFILRFNVECFFCDDDLTKRKKMITNVI